MFNNFFYKNYTYELDPANDKWNNILKENDIHCFFMNDHADESFKILGFEVIKIIFYYKQEICGVIKLLCKKLGFMRVIIKCGGREEGNGFYWFRQIIDKYPAKDNFYSESFNLYDFMDYFETQVFYKILKKKYGLFNLWFYSFYFPDWDDETIANFHLSNLKQIQKITWAYSSIFDLKNDNEFSHIFEKRVRNDITCGIKRGCVFEEGTIEDYYSLRKKYDYKNLSSSLLSNFDNFYKFHGNLLKKRLEYIHIIKMEEKPIAFAVYWVSGDKIILNDCGFDKDFKNCKPLTVLIYKSMLYFKEKGFISFDLGGISKNEKDTISYFKMGFNGKTYGVKRSYGVVV